MIGGTDVEGRAVAVRARQDDTRAPGDDVTAHIDG